MQNGHVAGWGVCGDLDLKSVGRFERDGEKITQRFEIGSWRSSGVRPSSVDGGAISVCFVWQMRKLRFESKKGREVEILVVEIEKFSRKIWVLAFWKFY